ncbi:hypothetical protein GTR02_17145 [Kineococcus sp. R8]|uniref:hypothetical protein n=1 Tax=Kineococcus siccus TaxID=2696567 RepID=UPI001412C429|nr:hypothetical protein [Kineococcus siccus]NAZ83544.1 hypothetical protein [Kineococcus siccus]
MHVVISPAGAVLSEAADTTAFDVRVVDVDEPGFTAVLERSGVGAFQPVEAFPGGHVEVRLDWIRTRAAAQDVPAGWDDAFAAMLAHAGRRGWLSSDGSSVRGHVVAGAPPRGE